MLPRPCLSCRTELCVPGKSRCPRCQSMLDKLTSRKKYAKRAAAPGDGAQQRLRKELNKLGGWRCRECKRHMPACDLEVDHVVALADGGADYDGNVQVLCKSCHVIKTQRENASRRKS